MFREVLQIVTATVITLAICFLWYNPLLFGRIWCSYQFPNECRPKGNQWDPRTLYLTVVGLVIQNTIFTGAINGLILAMTPYAPAFGIPLLCAGVASTLVACASLPYYLFAEQPFPIYMFHTGHATMQISASIFTIYLLA